MERVDEQTLQLWEQNPGQHRAEIRRMEKRFAKSFCDDFESGNSWYLRNDLTPAERERHADEDHTFYTQWARLINLVNRIIQMEIWEHRFGHEQCTGRRSAAGGMMMLN